MRYKDRATKSLMATMAQKNLADRSRTREMRMPYGQRMMERYVQTAEPQIDNANAMLPQPPQPQVPQQQPAMPVDPMGMRQMPQPPALPPQASGIPQAPPQVPSPQMPSLPPQAAPQAQTALNNNFAGAGAMGGGMPQMPPQAPNPMPQMPMQNRRRMGV